MKNTYKVNEEAVKKIAERVYDNGSTVINRNDLEEMFPALKESESESTRKELVSFFENILNRKGNEHSDGDCKRWIAWLEKQGEQKPAENKGMDLAEEGMTPFQKKVFCIVDTAIEEEQGLSNICNELLALAKQEIEHKPADTEKGAKGNEREISNSVWSEDDEVRFNSLHKLLNGFPLSQNWLKSLKDRVQHQSTWKPSAEQMEALDIATMEVWTIQNKEHLSALYQDLKNLTK